MYINITTDNIPRPLPEETQMCFNQDPEFDDIKESRIEFLRYKGQREITIYVSPIYWIFSITILTMLSYFTI